MHRTFGLAVPPAGIYPLAGLIQINLCRGWSFFPLATPWGLWELNSLTRDWTHVLDSEVDLNFPSAGRVLLTGLGRKCYWGSFLCPSPRLPPPPRQPPPVTAWWQSQEVRITATLTWVTSPVPPQIHPAESHPVVRDSNLLFLEHVAKVYIHPYILGHAPRFSPSLRSLPKCTTTPKSPKWTTAANVQLSPTHPPLLKHHSQVSAPKAGSLLSAHQISAGIYAQRRLFTENENDSKVFLIVMHSARGWDPHSPRSLHFHKNSQPVQCIPSMRAGKNSFKGRFVSKMIKSRG